MMTGSTPPALSPLHGTLLTEHQTTLHRLAHLFGAWWDGGRFESNYQGDGNCAGQTQHVFPPITGPPLQLPNKKVKGFVSQVGLVRIANLAARTASRIPRRPARLADRCGCPLVPTDQGTVAFPY